MSDDHLKEDFDPATLKMPKLRGILLDNGVNYASNAKKSELVALFHKHVGKSPKPADSETAGSKSSGSDAQARKLEVKKQRSDKNSGASVDKQGGSEASQRKESSGKVAKQKTRKNSKRREKSESIEKSEPEAAKRGPKIEHISLVSSQESLEPKQAKVAASEVPSSEKTEVAKPGKVALTPQKQSPASNSASSRKRKSMLDEVDMKVNATPTKGNIFEVDSDSEPEVLSARRKKTRYDTRNDVLPSSPRINKIVTSNSSSEKRKSSPSAAEKASSKAEANATNESADSTIEYAAAGIQKTASGQKSADVTVGNVSQLDKSALLATPARKTLAALEAKIQTPVLEKIVPEPQSSESSVAYDESVDEPSIFFKSHQSFDASRHPKAPSADSPFDSTASAAHSFDSALSKLKRETRGDEPDVLDENSPDMASLLNFGASVIKPRTGRAPERERDVFPTETLLGSSESTFSEKVHPGEFENTEKNGQFSKDEDAFEDVSDEDEDVTDLTAAVANNSTPADSEKAQQAATPAKTSKSAKSSKSPKSSKSSKSPKIPKTKTSGAKAAHSTPSHAGARPSVWRALAFFSLWLTLVGGLLFGYWYREQTFLVGYCGTSTYRRTIPNTPETPELLVRFGEFLDANYRPECVECPQHARCFPRLEIACYDDFVASSPWYYPYLPNLNLKAQKCVSDTKKAEKIEIMIDVALDLLRARNANVNCGRSEDDLHAGLAFSELHDLLLALKAPYITEEEFEELWARSVVELEKEPEIIVRFPGDYDAPTVDPHAPAPAPHDQNKVFRSTSLSHTTITCMMSNTVLALALRFKRALAALCAVSALIYACYWKYTQSKTHALKVETIYHEVLGKLRKQSKARKMSRELPEYIGSVQLRDSILSSETNLAYKMRLWQSVSHKVDRNTNVKSDLLEVYGEMMKVWQWIADFE